MSPLVSVERAPHRVALAQRRSVLGEHLVLLDHPWRPPARPISAVPSAEPASTTSTSSTTPGLAQRTARCRRARRRSCRRTPWSGSPPPPTSRPCADAAARAGTRRPRSAARRPKTRPRGRPTARARRGRSARADVRTRTSAARRIGMPCVGQPLGERRVLERRQRLEPADRAVRAGGDADRRAGEVMVGGAGVGLADALEALPRRRARAGAAPPAGAAATRSGSSSISPATARAPARTCASWRSSQSGAGRESASVQAIRPSGASLREQPLGGEIHASPPGRARARPGPSTSVSRSAELARGPLGRPPRCGRRRRRARGSSRTPRAARSAPPSAAMHPCDPVLLVARRDDDDARSAPRCPLGDQRAAALVVLVGFVGEHADDLAVAAIPGGERAVAVLLEPRLRRTRLPRPRT